MILKNVTFYNELFELEAGDIKIENGKIAEIGIIDMAGENCEGLIAMPGFIDIHIHGRAGADASDGTAEAIEVMADSLAKAGVTSFCPTTMTLPVEKLQNLGEIIGTFAENQKSGAKVLGINFEGPFISKEKKGAQNEAFIKAGNIEDFEKIYTSSHGLMKLMTVAPEAFPSDDFIKTASKKCSVSIGHSAANAKECQRAVDCGANHATHLYNAMTPMAHREAGIVGTVLDNEGVMCELICDGAHVSPAVLRNTFKILGENRGIVISDSMRAAGLGEGEFELGGQQVFVDEGAKYARLQNGTIAASITNVFEEFKNLISFGIGIKTALKACTINPAKSIGAQNRVGSIATGKEADIIFVDENLNLKAVMINGRWSVGI